jgi:hypothetical protein
MGWKQSSARASKRPVWRRTAHGPPTRRQVYVLFDSAARGPKLSERLRSYKWHVRRTPQAVRTFQAVRVAERASQHAVTPKELLRPIFAVPTNAARVGDAALGVDASDGPSAF